MRLLEEKYCFTGHLGTPYSLTAQELYERILEDSKSDYNWIAPARELVRVLKESTFPAGLALSIKIAILNCFANIEHQANCGGDRYSDHPEDLEAVHYCYNSLYGVDTEDAISARRSYLTEMLTTASDVSAFDPLYHSGPTYAKLRKDWIAAKFEEYISQENVDFTQLVQTLPDDFAQVVKTAQANGDFEEDDAKEKAAWRSFFEKIKDL